MSHKEVDVSIPKINKSWTFFLDSFIFALLYLTFPLWFALKCKHWMQNSDAGVWDNLHQDIPPKACIHTIKKDSS